MNNSNRPEDSRPDTSGRAQRIEAIKTWIEYIESEPPETWGPQQNAIVNGQLEAAQRADLPVSHRQRVRDVASDIFETQERTETDSGREK